VRSWFPALATSERSSEALATADCQQLGIALAQLPRGPQVALLGRKGVGTTELLKAVTGTLPVAVGKIMLDG
jgi:ABC-type cobalamin/Fe3+-siderophores transport system ATPase subunit